jgi:streptogramin lyase
MRPPVAPSQPIQQGSADGFEVAVGHNGAVRFTQNGATPILRRLVGQSAGSGCFRLTKEFGSQNIRPYSLVF